MPDTTNRQPNLLIMLPDQWRRQALGCDGDAVVDTPHLDRLAEQGTRFTRCYGNSPVCSPCRAVLQTGRYVHQTGLIKNSLYLEQNPHSLANTLGQAGYATGYIGKWHLDGRAKPGYVPADRRQGWEEFVGFNRGHIYGPDAQPVYYTSQGQRISPEVYEPYHQTDLAIDFIERHRDQPFALLVSWGPPHMPYTPPPEYDHYTAGDLQWRANVPEPCRRDPGMIRDLCGYYGLCELLDHEAGRLLQTLEDQALTDRTHVVFTSDHGDMHGSHGLIHKSKPHEESFGVPLIIRGPGLGAGQRVDGPVSTVDLTPTLLELAGVGVPPTMMGRPFLPRMQGIETPMPWVYGQCSMMGPAEWRSLVLERYKISVCRNGVHDQLIDLQEDPYEMANLFYDPGRAQLKRDLLEELTRVGRQLQDPWPNPVAPAPAEPE